jgi:hypothetical protein
LRSSASRALRFSASTSSIRTCGEPGAAQRGHVLRAVREHRRGVLLQVHDDGAGGGTVVLLFVL